MSTWHAITLYVPDPVWQTLQTEARQGHTTIADVIVDTLERAVPATSKTHPVHARSAPQFARMLGQERERHGWSYRELARQADVDTSLIWRYEAGKRAPSRYTVGVLARVLQLSLNETTAFYRAAGFVWEGVEDAS